MKILPPSTQPWSEVLVRRHQPLRNFRAERRRQCLRWEFGFTCAFCLTHESDLAFCGAEGTGLTAIEHFVPRSVDPGRLHDYSNLFYICYSCNRARGRQPVEEKLGRRLLNPCEAVWAAHFERVGNRLEPLDENARYTEKLYKLNSGAKMQIRAARRSIIETRIKYLEELRRTTLSLLESGRIFRSRAAAELLPSLTELEKFAWEDLVRFMVIPFDAQDCLCPAETRTLPPDLDAAAIDLRTL